MCVCNRCPKPTVSVVYFSPFGGGWLFLDRDEKEQKTHTHVKEKNKLKAADDDDEKERTRVTKAKPNGPTEILAIFSRNEITV